MCSNRDDFRKPHGVGLHERRSHGGGSLSGHDGVDWAFEVGAQVRGLESTTHGAASGSRVHRGTNNQLKVVLK